MSGRTILVVDDDADLRGALADALEDEGYAVARAGDGFEAIDYLRSHSAPDLIVLDWMMPNCNGPCFRRLQGEDPALRDIPVVVLTADVRIEEKLDETAPETCLLKPAPLDLLLQVVERYVSEH